MDRYNIFSRPYVLESSYTIRYIPLSFSPMVHILETKVTYGITSLLADMGGFLGLLLGYSILSVFDDVKIFATKGIMSRFTSAITKQSAQRRPKPGRKHEREFKARY